MTIGSVEDAIAKEMASLHKELTGRGPRNVLVRLLGDVIAFRFADALTPLERSLLPCKDGVSRIRQLRGELLQVCMERLDPTVRRLTGADIQDFAGGFDPETGRVYGVIALGGGEAGQG